MQRIVVLGTSGAGKSTVSAILAERLSLPHVDLDELANRPGRQKVPDDEFRARVHSVVGQQRWVVDGDYERKLGDLVLTSADTAIWLELPLRVTVARMWKRTAHLIRNKVEVRHGDVLTWRLDLLRWLAWEIRSHVRRRFTMRLRLARHEGLTVMHIRSQRQVDDWLARPPIDYDASGPSKEISPGSST